MRASRSGWRRSRYAPAVGVGFLLAALAGCGQGSPSAVTATAKGGPQAVAFAAPPAPVAQFVANKASDAPPTPETPQHQEHYAHVVENDFRAAAQAPLSTFSADVNTAGYSNVRRFLDGGQLPPKDAVRLAELLNYFPYEYPAPVGNAPVAFDLAAAPCPWRPRHALVRVGVRAKAIDPSNTPPRNLVFLVDTSGSMQGGRRLPLVQRGLNMLVDTLTPRDVVTVVTYAGTAGVALPPTAGDRKGRIRAAVAGLTAGGGTNGAGGLRAAYEHARTHYIDGGANRVILCTDGDFNVGVTSPGELVRLIEEERRANVFLTVLGFGMGNVKDATLELLARHGNGHYAYLDSDAEARKVFVEQAGALVAVAKDVKFQVEFNPAAVSAYRLLGYENRLLRDEDFKNDAADAGDLGGGHTVTALYEVVPAGVRFESPGVDPLKYRAPPVAAGPAGEWLTAKMRDKHPESAASLEVSAVLPATAIDRPASPDFVFAGAVAEFGLLIRDSPHKGDADYTHVLAAAEASLGRDPGGHRAEFTALVRKARKLTDVGSERASR